MAIIILTICYSLTLILFSIFLHIVNKNRKKLFTSLQECCHLNEEILKNNRDLISFNDKIIQELNEKDIICVYLMMSVAAKDKDYQTFTGLYQQMYFFGVQKDILDDQTKLHKFIGDIMEHKVKITKGVSPFKFQFEMQK